MKRIYRTAIPVDGKVHIVEMKGDVLHVGCRNPLMVEMWHSYDNMAVPVRRAFEVYGTGQPMEEDTKYLGTAVAPDGDLVWHLCERYTRSGGGTDE